MSPVVNLLPAQQGILVDEPNHRYSVWSERRQRWMHPASTSQALTISGAKGFNSRFWYKSLIEKHGMRPDEAALYMELHRNNRADVGTELHGLIRAELLGGSYHPKLAESLMLLSVWRREFLPQVECVILCESPLASLNHFFTGTPDLIALVSGRWLGIDWKSKMDKESAKPDSGWRLQLTGYDLLAEENHGIRLDGAMNLMIWRKGMQDVYYNRADLDLSRLRFIGHLSWSHAVLAIAGQLDYAEALAHLLQLHPQAPSWAEPPTGYGLESIGQALAMIGG